VTALRTITAVWLALFVIGAGMQDTVLLCRSLGTTHHACCCVHRAEEPARGVELSRAPCCDASAVDATAIPPSAGAAATFFVASPVMILEAPHPQSTGTLERSVPRAARAVPTLATGPPLHILHRALLI
jgi:hypothetical protein